MRGLGCSLRERDSILSLGYNWAKGKNSGEIPRRGIHRKLSGILGKPRVIGYRRYPVGVWGEKRRDKGSKRENIPP
jgi:hypothetical protein